MNILTKTQFIEVSTILLAACLTNEYPAVDDKFSKAWDSSSALSDAIVLSNKKNYFFYWK